MEQSSEQMSALQRALDALEQAGISYAITGSWVVSAYGVLRATHDLDVVIAIRGDEAPRIAAAFPCPPYFYADEEFIRESLAARTMFNIIDGDSSLKVDFWPLQADDYSREQFRRRRKIEMGGRQAWALSPEDIILAKLLWIKISDSERQWRDVESVWALKKDQLDVDYLKAWAGRISVSSLLARVMK
ncbi:MAG TPA: hypothetical protein VJL59_11880 [Anaerolineales bacterium]|nr:hypothetical protein [Anaerolineales bacterium]